MSQLKQNKIICRNKQCGQTTVELAILGSVLLPIVFFVLVGSYVTFARSWTRHALYEGLICLSEGALTRTCEKEIKSKISFFLDPNHNNKIKLWSLNKNYRAAAELNGLNSLINQIDRLCTRCANGFSKLTTVTIEMKDPASHWRRNNKRHFYVY